MSLFEEHADPTINLLPVDGIVNYYGKVIAQNEADLWLARLLKNIAWRSDEAIVFGKRIATKRKIAWYGDKNYSYTYSSTTRQALPWTGELLILKKLAEAKTGEKYNSCLLNLYHTGEEGVAWHADGEKALKENGAIASLSFGAERKFTFKHKQTKQKTALILEHGSLLVMKGTTQAHWMHSLPKAKQVAQPRISLTFRLMV